MCRGARNAAKKLYCVWLKQIRGEIYVDKEHDIFYFGDNAPSVFLFLDAVVKHKPGVSTRADDIERELFMNEIKDIRNLAINLKIFQDAFEENLSLWFETVSDVWILNILFHYGGFGERAFGSFCMRPQKFRHPRGLPKGRGGYVGLPQKVSVC